MSTTDQLVDQARHLVAQARLLSVGEAAKVLEQVSTISQAAQAEALVEGERGGALRDSGRSTVRSFATTILRRSGTDAGQLAQVARHLVCFPKLAAAYRAGAAHTANLRAVMQYVVPCGLAVLQAHEDMLVQLATRAGPGEIHEFCRAVLEVNRPDKDKDKVTANGARLVRIVRVGDLAHLDAMLDPELADQLKATLSAMAKAARTPDDERSHAERSAQALEQLLRRGMDTSDLPARARRRPHTNLSVQLETLLRMPGHGKAWLERFGLIPAGTAERIACDSLIRLIVCHGDRVLNVGHSQRLVTDKQLTALAAMYATCVVPGCDVRFSDCDIHHVWWWHLGGPTDLDLLVPLCKHDHTRLHEHGYTLSREAGAWIFRDPLGRIIGDPIEVLHDQLDLLNGEENHPNADDRTGDELTAAIDACLAEVTSHYDAGTWGWTGLHPNPPPGHGPPHPADNG